MTPPAAPDEGMPVSVPVGGGPFDGPYEAFQSSDEPAAKAYLAEMPALHARGEW